MNQFLRALTTRSEMIDAELAAERQRDVPDGERLVELKRIKRQLGFQTAVINREARHGAQAPTLRHRGY